MGTNRIFPNAQTQSVNKDFSKIGETQFD